MVENLLKILAKKGRRFTIAYKCHSVTNVVGESISSVTCGIFIVKQLGKHDFPCDFLLLSKHERQGTFFRSDE